jgi:predicted metallo-beta-lactamase superfamily hydrolase
VKILKETKSEIILNHHLLRDLKYKEIYPVSYKKDKKELKLSQNI